MQPMGQTAGMAASLTGSYATATGALLGTLIAGQFDGTILPLFTGFAVLGCLCLAVGTRGGGPGRPVPRRVKPGRALVDEARSLHALIGELAMLAAHADALGAAAHAHYTPPQQASLEERRCAFTISTSTPRARRTSATSRSQWAEERKFQQAVQTPAGHRHHLPRDLRRLRPRLASSSPPPVHHQPRRRRARSRPATARAGSSARARFCWSRTPRGKGHLSKSVGGKMRHSIFVPID